MGFIKEFREFAVKGNVVDLAVGLIVGAAFSKLVDSVVNDLMMPLLSAIIGTPDFSNLYLILKGSAPAGASLADARASPNTVVFAYGNFLTVLVDFLLMALIIFIMIKAINKMKRKQEVAVVTTQGSLNELSTTDKLLAEIRDELKNSRV